MSKKEMLIEYIIQDIVDCIMKDEELSLEDAMQRFYGSQTFLKLTDVDTGLYLDASASVYDLYRNKSINGRIVQNEI